MLRTTTRAVPTFAAIAFAAVVSDASAQTWSELTPSSGSAPAARRNASAILDPVGNSMVIFGGFSAGYRNDIWAFDLGTETWEDLTPASGPAPAPRLFPASVYDPDGHQMITWSGQGPGVFFNDVWAFDLDTGAWSQYSPAGGPPAIRYGVGYTWDPKARDLVTFAGFTNQGRFHDVWRFNDQSVTWSDVSPVTNPLERCLHVACYDALAHRMIMYGGQNNGPLNDLWALDLNNDTWTDITPAANIPGRFFATAVYDAANRRMTVFGGQTPSNVNEVWVFDLWNNAWTQLSPGGTPPSARYGSASVYDGANDRMVVFGGFDTTVQGDVWSLENLSGTATGVRPATASAATLHPNHPNPFNPTTTIRFELLTRGAATLRIFDARGRAVRTLFSGVADAGTTVLTWNGRDDDGRVVSSGVYFYRLETTSGALSRKMVLLK
jgi:hypothetical protein